MLAHNVDYAGGAVVVKLEQSKIYCLDKVF